MRILVIHGPNLNLLGTRNPAVYGSATLDDLNKTLRDAAQQRQVSLDCVQSNLEGEIVNSIQGTPGRYQAIVINPAAYTHTSVAIRDATTDSPVYAGNQTGLVHRPPVSLVVGRTYYWRVDEVNAPPDSTVYPGDVWHFTVEPLSIPVEMVTPKHFHSGVEVERSHDE